MKGYKIGFSEIDDNGNQYLCYALIELEIPERYPGAKIYSFRSKNRTNVARVLRINKLILCNSIFSDQAVKDTNEQIDSAFSIFDNDFYYRPGEIVYPDRFDEKKARCSNGIHFFMYRKDAIDYIMDDWVIDRFYSCMMTRKVPIFCIKGRR